MLPKIVVIVGPTASGKTALGIEIAKRFNGEVVCADSRTVYRGMDIGTAKVQGDKKLEIGNWKLGGGVPTVVEDITHWGLDLVEPDEEFSVSQFKDYAIARINDIVRRGKLPIIVGGTGMWIWALVDNLTLTETPPDPALRVELEARSLDDLFAEYKHLDPNGAEVIDRDNKRRLVRALEVTRKTGKPFSAQMTKGEPIYNALQIGMEVDREELNRRCDDRVDAMIANGLIDEVRGLKEQFGCETNAMSGIGYRQVCAFLDNKANLQTAITDIKRATRAYARRQMTWFRRDPRIMWIKDPQDAFPLLIKEGIGEVHSKNAR